MSKLDEQGNLVVPLVISIILLIAALSFGVWAFNSRNDYKNNVEPKISAAVETAKQQEDAAKDKELAEKEKLPLKTYTGPSQYGSVSIQYPKTWSAYVDETGTGTTVLDGYFHPGFVPGLQSKTDFALRLQVVQSPYDKELKQYDDETKVGKVVVNPFAAVKVNGIVGARLDGQIMAQKQGSLVLLPLRDKTLKIWTEVNQFMPDFNNNILPNLTFSP